MILISECEMLRLHFSDIFRRLILFFLFFLVRRSRAKEMNKIEISDCSLLLKTRRSVKAGFTSLHLVAKEL